MSHGHPFWVYIRWKYTLFEWFYLSGVELIARKGSTLTVMQTNKALAHKSDIVDIYTNSWGPRDASQFQSLDQPSIDSLITVGFIITW